MRRGVTLLELLVVLTIMGVLAGIVIPGSTALADRLAVEHQAARLLVAYRSAWVAARAQQRLAILRICGTPSTSARCAAPAPPTPPFGAWLAPGPGLAGVSIQGAPHTTVFARTGRGWAWPTRGTS